MTGEDRDLILAELHDLRAEVRRLKYAAAAPRHGIIRVAVRDLETNPRSQYAVHRIGVYYWLANMPLVAVLFFFAQTLWLKWGVFIILEYSIYANLATDYAGLSAAMAAFGDLPPPPDPAPPT